MVATRLVFGWTAGAWGLLLGTAWLGSPLDRLVQPWGGVLGLFLALPYWVLSYLPCQLLRFTNLLLLRGLLPISEVPPPLNLVPPDSDLRSAVLSSLAVAVVAVLLYGYLLNQLIRRIDSWRRVASVGMAAGCAGVIITWIQWFSGIAIDLFGNGPTSAGIEWIAAVVTYPQGLVLKSLGGYLPELVVYSGHLDWKGFADLSSALTLLTAGMCGGILWPLNRLLHQPRATPGTRGGYFERLKESEAARRIR